MNLPSAARRNRAQLCRHGRLPHDREEGAVEHRGMLAAVCLIKEDLAGKDVDTWALGRPVQHVHPVRPTEDDLVWRKDDRRMLIPILRMNSHLDDVPLAQGAVHRPSGSASAGIELMKATRSSAGIELMKATRSSVIVSAPSGSTG